MNRNNMVPICMLLIIARTGLTMKEDKRITTTHTTPAKSFHDLCLPNVVILFPPTTYSLSFTHLNTPFAAHLPLAKQAVNK